MVDVAVMAPDVNGKSNNKFALSEDKVGWLEGGLFSE